jgi:hypothetical protein
MYLCYSVLFNLAFYMVVVRNQNYTYLKHVMSWQQICLPVVKVYQPKYNSYTYGVYLKFLYLVYPPFRFIERILSIFSRRSAFGGQPQSERPLERYRLWYEDNFKVVFKEVGFIWNGSIWLMIGTSGWQSSRQEWFFGFYKRKRMEIYWPTSWSIVGLSGRSCFMESVI